MDIKNSKERNTELCSCCWERRDNDQVVSLSVSHRICFSCIEVGIKFLNDKIRIRPANWIRSKSNDYYSNIRTYNAFTICEDCLRGLYKKIANPKNQIRQHFDLKSSPLPLLPAIEVQKHYSKEGKIVKLTNCELCGSEDTNLETSMATASGLNGPRITYDNKYKGDLIKSFGRIGLGLIGIVGISYVMFLGIRWFISTSVGQEISYGLGVILFIVGLVIGAASAPMGYKDGSPGNSTQGTIGLIILILGVLLMGLTK